MLQFTFTSFQDDEEEEEESGGLRDNSDPSTIFPFLAEGFAPTMTSFVHDNSDPSTIFPFAAEGFEIA